MHWGTILMRRTTYNWCNWISWNSHFCEGSPRRPRVEDHLCWLGRVWRVWSGEKLTCSMCLTIFLGKFRLLILCTWGPSRRADICSSFRHEFTVVMAPLLPLEFDIWSIVSILLPQADPPNPDKIPEADLVGVTVVLLTCSYRSAGDRIWDILSQSHTFLISRIHPCWLLCEHWLHWAWVERDAPLPPSLGKTPAEHLGHKSQVLLWLKICVWNICQNPSLCQSDQVQDQLGRKRGSRWELWECSAQARSKSAFWQFSGGFTELRELTLFFLTFSLPQSMDTPLKSTNGLPAAAATMEIEWSIFMMWSRNQIGQKFVVGKQIAVLLKHGQTLDPTGIRDWWFS